MSKNSKTAIVEIKKLMKQFGFLAEETPLMSFKLQDDTIIQTEKLEAGNAIMKINEAFEQVALEDGSYRFKENFEVEVKDGKIEHVKEIFLEAKLVDGTVVKVEGDSLVEGAAVKVVSDQGEIPAPDGVHELEDGTKVEVKEGKISSVKAPEAPLENPDEEEKPEGGEKVDVDIMDMLKEFIKRMSDKMSAMEAQLSKVQNEFNSFKKEPAGKKVGDGKTEFNKIDENDDIDSRINAIMALRNKK